MKHQITQLFLLLGLIIYAITPLRAQTLAEGKYLYEWEVKIKESTFDFDGASWIQIGTNKQFLSTATQQVKGGTDKGLTNQISITSQIKPSNSGASVKYTPAQDFNETIQINTNGTWKTQKGVFSYEGFTSSSSTIKNFNVTFQARGLKVTKSSMTLKSNKTEYSNGETYCQGEPFIFEVKSPIKNNPMSSVTRRIKPAGGSWKNYTGVDDLEVGKNEFRLLYDWNGNKYVTGTKEVTMRASIPNVSPSYEVYRYPSSQEDPGGMRLTQGATINGIPGEWHILTSLPASVYDDQPDLGETPAQMPNPPASLIASDYVILKSGEKILAFEPIGSHKSQVCGAVLYENFGSATKDLAIPIISNEVSPTCKGGNDGSFTVTAKISGDESRTANYRPFKYEITNISGFYITKDSPASTSTSHTFTGLPAGNYTVKITDARTQSKQVSVNIPNGLDISFSAPTSITDISCWNTNTGAVTLKAASGASNCQYKIVNNSTSWSTTWTPNSLSYSNLSEGSYTAFARVADGCVEKSVNFTIDGPNSALEIDELEKTDITCRHANDGKVSVLAFGGGTPYQYRVGGGSWQSSNQFTNLSSGSHTFYVRDKWGCVVSQSITVNQPSASLSLSNVTTKSVISCDGSAEIAELKVKASGGWGYYHFRWRKDFGAWSGWKDYYNTTLFDEVVTNQVGTYQFEVAAGDVDGNIFLNCTKSISISVTKKVFAWQNFPNVTDVTCPGGNDGRVTFRVGGAKGPHDIKLSSNEGYYANWTTNDGSWNTRTNLTAGVYTLTIYSHYGCKLERYFNVIDPPDFKITQAPVVKHPSCFGSSDGEMTVSISGGSGGLSYRVVGSGSHTTWNSATKITGLKSGTHVVQVKDNRGCTTSFNAGDFDDYTGVYPELIDPDELELDIFTTVHITCEQGSDGEIDLGAYGGTGDYLYGITGPVTKTQLNNGYFKGLPKGTYSVWVRDAHACQTTKNVVLEELNPKPRLSYTETQPLCHESDDGKLHFVVTNPVAPSYDYVLQDDQSNMYYSLDGNFEHLKKGNYELVVTALDSYCESDIFFATVTAPALLTLSGVKTDISCYGGSDGMIQLTASGGTPPYTYTVNGDVKTGVSTVSYIGLGLGVYNVKVVDAHGCEVLTHPDLTIEQPDLLVFNSVITSTLCHGNSDGTITVHASGGTTAYEYSKDGGNTYQSNNVFTGLPAGTYFVTVRDAQGCTTGHTAYVPQPDPLKSFTTVTDVICKGVAMGVISFYQTQGGTVPYSYSIDGDQNYTQGKTLFTGLLAGTYDVWVKDANNCKIQMSVDVKEPANKIKVETTNHQHISCFGGSDGILFVSATDRVGNYIYSLDGLNFQSSQEFNNLTAQTYTITTKDMWGCLATNTFTLTEPNEIIFSTAVINLTCFETQDGQIKINPPTGGNGSYVYSIDNGVSFQSVPNFTGLVAGTYPTIVQDKLGCISKTKNVIITEPNPLVIDANISDVKCYLGSDGQITFQGIGGTAPYKYDFNKQGTFQTSPTYGSLTKGTYFITVQDSHLCEYATSVTVNEPTPFTATAQVNASVLCKGEATGVIEISPTGGVGGYTYSVDGGTNFITASSSITGLIAGNYQVVVQDANGCLAPAGFYTVVEPAQKLGFTSITQTMTSCFGKPDAVVDIQAMGGVAAYQYALDNGAYKSTSIFVGVSGGNHALHIRDAHGCIFTKPFTIIEPAPLTFTSVKTPLTCFESEDGTFTLNASGGISPYVYSIDNGVSFQSASNFTGLKAGDYNILFKDKKGCLSPTENVTIIQPDLLVLNNTINHVSCFGVGDASITLHGIGGNGGYQYNFDGQGFKTQSNYTGLFAGNYFVTVRDAKGCTYSKTVMITQPAQIQAVASVQRHVYCKHDATGIIDVNINGGTAPYSYSLNGSPFTTVLDGLVDGVYDVDVKDAQGCTTNAGFVTITEPANILTTQVSSTKNITCFAGSDGEVQFDAQGGTAPYYFSLDNVSFTSVIAFTGLSIGNYTLYVKDKNACTVTTSFTLTQPNQLEFTYAKTPLTCFESQDGTITLQNPIGGQGGYTYSTDGINFQTNPVLTGLDAGVYGTRIKDAVGCISDPVFVTVIQPDALEFTVQMIPNTCKGRGDGQLFVTAQGGNGSYEWKKDGGIFQPTTQLEHTNLDAGFYSITLRDAKGCVLTKKIEVTEPDYLQATLDITHVSCKGGNDGQFTVNTTGGTAPFIYSLDNINFTSVPTFTGFSKSAGQVYFQDAKGCNGLVQYVITEPTQLEIAFVSVQPVICKGDNTGQIIPTMQGGTPPYYYSRNGLDFQTANRLEDFSVGTYEITIKDDLGCTITESIEVTEPDEVLRGWITDVEKSVCGGATGTLTAKVTGGVAPYQFVWDDEKEQTTAKAEGLAAGIYTVLITDAYGCQMSLVHEIEDAEGPKIGGLKYWRHPSCHQAENGVIHLTIENGEAPFSAMWKDKKHPEKDLSQYTQLRAEGLGAGEYLILVEDRNGCKVSATIPLTEPDSLTLEVSEVTHLHCFDMPEGVIRVQAHGGTTSYTYHVLTWEGKTIKNKTGVFTKLTAGTYQVWVEDRFGCETTPVLIELLQPDLLQVSTLNKENPQCFEDIKGWIETEVTGGVEPYSYIWSNRQTTSKIEGLSAGNYELLVQDANGCQVALHETLVEPKPLEVTNFGKTPPSCYQVCDGTAFVEVKGGTAPYIYQWNDAQKQTEAKAISLCTGNYTVTVTDANGCQITQTIEIEETPELTLEVINTQEISCFEGCNGKVQVQANGGTGKYSYTWSHDESVNQSAASNLCQGTYSITVTDKNGCEATTEVVLTHPDQLQSELPSEVYVCNDKGTQLDAGKDWAGYSWENEFGEELGTNRILENAQVGTYTLYTFNEEGCMLQDEIEVRQSERYFVGNFVIPTVTEVGKEVHLADISWPKPDAVEWVIKEGSPTVLEETNYGKTLQFHQAGEYTVAFTAQLGECVDYLEKKIEVYPPATSPQTPQVVDLQDEIFVLGLYPNPNNGRFTVGIRLKEVQDVTLKVYGLYAQGMILEEKTVKGQQDYEVPFQMRLPAGAYVVTIQTQNTIKHISFIKE